MSDAQRAALDELRFGSPGPARRGELKSLLGWRRTRPETVAYAGRLLGEGMAVYGAARTLAVGERYLRRLLAEAAKADSASRKPAWGQGKSGTNRPTLTAESSPRERPSPGRRFQSFAELDAWLEERR
jgi:hypothetical protein